MARPTSLHRNAARSKTRKPIHTTPAAKGATQRARAVYSITKPKRRKLTAYQKARIAHEDKQEAAEKTERDAEALEDTHKKVEILRSKLATAQNLLGKVWYRQRLAAAEMKCEELQNQLYSNQNGIIKHKLTPTSPSKPINRRPPPKPVNRRPPPLRNNQIRRIQMKERSYK